MVDVYLYDTQFGVINHPVNNALTRADFEKYVENGQVDFIGGYFSVGTDLTNIDSLFEFAETTGCPSICTSTSRTPLNSSNTTTFWTMRSGSAWETSSAVGT